MNNNIEPSTLLNYLKEKHIGNANAVKSKTMESLFQCSGVSIRKAVNELRCQGYPVCSGPEGYFYASNNKLITDTISQLSNRTMGINNAINGLVNCIEKRQYEQNAA